MGRVIAAVGVLFALLVTPAAAAPAAAPGTVAFSSNRCDGGAPPSGGPSPGCRGGIFTIAGNGSGLTRLSDGAWPAWSPDGTQIAFSNQTGGGSGERVYVMGSDGSDRRHLADPPPGWNSASRPAWSPTGGAIAFEAQLPTNISEPFAAVHLLDLATRTTRRISPPGTTAMSPAFTADGSRVVYFTSQLVGPPGPDAQFDNAVHSTTIAGTQTERLTLGDLDIAANGLAFSPDGQHLAVTRASRIYTMRSDGTDMVQRSDAIGINPSWSGDGRRLYWTGPAPGDPTGPPLGIYRLDLELPGPPAQVTDFTASDFAPVAFDPAPPALPDRLPPGVVLEGGDDPDFFAFDASGLRNVSVALARRANGRCRFVRPGGRLGKRRRCSRPVYRRAQTVAGWEKLTGRLAGGSYEARFRMRDANGNVNRKPRRMRFRLR